jgi:hypothetical protein
MKYSTATYGNVAKPKQKIAYSEKLKDDWGQRSAAYYKTACEPAIDRAVGLELYRLANGELDESDYSYVTNPLNTSRTELMGYPARLMNYDIISPNVNLLMGEKARRFFPPIVVARNSDYHSRQLERETQLMIAEAQKAFINELIATGVELDEEQITIKLEDIAKRVKNLPDELSNLGQDALEYIMDFNDLPRNYRKGFYDWVCTSMIYSYKDVCRGKTHYEIVSPLNVRYLCSPKYDFIEDGDAFVIEHIMSPNEIYDRFQEDKDWNKEIEEFIEQASGENVSGLTDKYYNGLSDVDTSSMQRQLVKNVFGSFPEEQYSDGIRVEHIQWRSLTEIGRLERVDIFGEKIIDYVTRDFKPLEGESIEWRWVDQIWGSYCIGDRYYLGTRPIPIQRGEWDNPNKAKLLINGRKHHTRHTTPKSIVAKGKAYQKSVNIIKYRAEETLAKNLDNIILFPLGLIPKKEGWDEFKLMYYVRSFSFLFFDDTRPNASAMISALKNMDMNSTKYIIESQNLINLIKQEWDETCGLNPQRKAQIGTSAGKGVTSEAIDRSYVMSEELFLETEEFEQREYTGMLELSKYAFSDGFQSHFTKQDGTRAFLNIHDPDSYVNADLGVFVRNGTKELNKLELLRQQVTAFAQNGADPGMIRAIIEAENFSKLHKIMDEIDAKMEARRQQELQVQQEIQASKERTESKALEFEYYSKDLASKTDIQVALIQTGMGIADEMRKMSENGTSNTDKETYGKLQVELERNGIELIKNATALKKISSDEKIARDKNKTMLANKVSGEK